MVGECSGKMRSTPWPNDTLRTVKEARTPPRLLAFKLGGKAAYPALAKAEPVPAPPGPRPQPALAEHGEQLFAAYQCEYCHGTDGGASVGGGVPNLNRTRLDLAAFKQVVQGGERRAGGMPQFKGLSDADAAALYAYVLNSAWNAHEGKTRGTATHRAF